MGFNAVEDRVLRYLESRFVAGGGFAHVTSDEIMKATGLQPDQFTRLLARFETLGILEEATLDGLIAIKKAVCQYVAELDRGNSSPPATVNVLNIGHVSHSQIQQGTIGSTQVLSPVPAARQSARPQGQGDGDVILSAGARSLLCAAEKTGQIIVCVDTGGLHVQAGGKQFGASPADPGRRARVESELDELVANGLITAQGQIRSVTARGYDWIDAMHGKQEL